MEAEVVLEAVWSRGLRCPGDQDVHSSLAVETKSIRELSALFVQYHFVFRTICMHCLIDTHCPLY